MGGCITRYPLKTRGESFSSLAYTHTTLDICFLACFSLMPKPFSIKEADPWVSARTMLLSSSVGTSHKRDCELGQNVKTFIKPRAASISDMKRQ